MDQSEAAPINGSQKRKPYHYSYNSTNNWEDAGSVEHSSDLLEGPSGSCTQSSSVDIEDDDDKCNLLEQVQQQSNVDDIIWSHRANYSRYLYYNQLRRRVIPASDDILLIPSHVIPTEFFYPHLEHTSDGKQNSLITIFAIWNTMMGTSLLNIPWAIERAGFIPGILLLSSMAFLSFYTAFRILQVFEAHENSVTKDLAVLCKRLLGRSAQVIAVVFSALTILGALVVYWVLMSNFLYHTVDYFHTTIYHDDKVFVYAVNDTGETIYCPSESNNTNVGLMESNSEDEDLFHKIWNLYRTVPIFLMMILGPLAIARSPTFFMKFNSLGTLSVLYLLIFVVVKWYEFGINLNFVDDSSPSFVPLFKSSCPALSGMLSLAFFIHNSIITILKNNRHQKNNKRDLSIAYLAVVITYFLIGFIFYSIFPLNKSCIEDNFLNNFRSSDLWTFIARIFLFFQMVTVFPLLMYILRVQICYSITQREPTTNQIYSIATVVITTCIMFAIFLPKIGSLLRFTGALCGLVYIFCLPICLYLKWQSNIGQLTWFNLIIHVGLMFVGLINFILQFVVSV